MSGDAGLSVGLVSGTACFSSVSEACVVSGDAEKLEAKEEEVKLQVAEDLRFAALGVCVCVVCLFCRIIELDITDSIRRIKI